MNYKQIIAKQKSAESRIRKAYFDPTEKSGIYHFYRQNQERGTLCVYVGQAKNLRQRIAQHLLEYDHIAVSLKKYGLYDKDKNPEGWFCEWEFWSQDQLDEQEQELIEHYLKQPNTEVYNITSGGQSKGKVDINQRAEKKGFYTGKQEGYTKAYAEIAELIAKYTKGLESKGGKTADRKTQELINKLKGV